MNRARRMMAGVGVLALAMAMPACLDAERVSALSYDAKTDAFTFLRVYYNIHGDTEGDEKKLLALYANRDHILPLDPIPFFGEGGLIRMEDGPRAINLPGATLGPQATTLPFDLSTLQNKPGRFFLSADAMACYYHQVVIPPAAADNMVAWVAGQGQEALAKLAADEIENRKDGAGQLTWEHEQKMLLDDLRGVPPEQAEKRGDEDKGLISAMDDASLRLLADAVTKKNFALKRKGTVLTATARLSAPDARHIDALAALLRAEAARRPSAADIVRDVSVQLQLDLVNTLQVHVAADGAIEISADIMKLEPLLVKMQLAGLTGVDKEKAGDYTRILDGIKAAGTPMDGPMSLADVVGKFDKGELKVNASEKPVKAGEGLEEK